MIDIQPDSPVPVQEQITGQIMAQVASGALPPGARLAEYRAFAEQHLTHPQVVARAYAELEWEGVLVKGPTGVMEVTSDAAVVCRIRRQYTARQLLRQAVADAVAAGLGEGDIRQAVDQALAALGAGLPTPPPALGAGLPTPSHESSAKATHASDHRDSQAIQILPRQGGRGSPEPEGPPGGHIRPPRR
jgi:GntR family transcriptional regulator